MSLVKYPAYYTVVNLRGAGGPPPPPLIWVKKEEMTEGRKAGIASKTTNNKIQKKVLTSTTCFQSSFQLCTKK